jgi:predicted O-methyltransferase YrrM
MMNEHEVADWLEANLPPSERLSQRETALWLGAQAREIGPSGWCAEIGVWCGYTALALALGGPKVVAVDTYAASDAQTGRQALEKVEGGLQGTLVHFLEHRSKVPEPITVFPVIGRSVDVAGVFGRNRFDLVFLDGDHSTQAVMSDLLAWSVALKPGGILCGHDYDQPSVRESVTGFFLSQGWGEPSAGPDQLWWGRKSK